MTLSSPKYQLQDLEPKAERFPPESAKDFTNDAEAHPDQWHELPCHVEPASYESEHERSEDLDGSFHEQLAALVRALDEEPGTNVDQGAEPELLSDDEDFRTSSDAHEELSSAGPGLISLASLGNVLNGRARGFAIGLGASLTLGGVLLMLAGGSGEPPVIANNPAQSEPRDIAFAPAADKAAELPLRTSLLDDFDSGPKDLADSAEQSGTYRAEAGEDAPLADLAAAVPGMMIEPADPPGSLDQAPDAAEKASNLADAFASATEPERAENLRDEGPAEVGISFETTVETASDSQTATEDVEPPTHTLASVDQTGTTAHVVKHVNMRAGPNNSAAVLAIIPEGQPVKVVQCDQWCEVIAEGQRGWIYKDLLSGVAGG